MHQNPAFRKTADVTNIDFARERGFGVLAISGTSETDAPILSHVPFDLSTDGKQANLHLMRSNPIVRAAIDPTPAVITVSGPDSYISPDWYEIDDQVPTWNYIAVDLRGVLTQLPAAAIRDCLDELTRNFENRLLPKTPWSNQKLPEDVLARMTRMIVPFRFDITDVQGTWKLGQNKPATGRVAAAKQVAGFGIGQETALLSALMLGVKDDSPR